MPRDTSGDSKRRFSSSSPIDRHGSRLKILVVPVPIPFCRTIHSRIYAACGEGGTLSSWSKYAPPPGSGFLNNARTLQLIGNDDPPIHQRTKSKDGCNWGRCRDDLEAPEERFSVEQGRWETPWKLEVALTNYRQNLFSTGDIFSHPTNTSKARCKFSCILTT